MEKLQVYAAIATIIGTLVGIMAYVNSVLERNRRLLEDKTDEEKYIKLILENEALHREREALRQQLKTAALAQKTIENSLPSPEINQKNILSSQDNASTPKTISRYTDKNYRNQMELSLRALDNILTFLFVWACFVVVVYGIVPDDYYIYFIVAVIFALTRLNFRD